MKLFGNKKERGIKLLEVYIEPSFAGEGYTNYKITIGLPKEAIDAIKNIPSGKIGDKIGKISLDLRDK